MIILLNVVIVYFSMLFGYEVNQSSSPVQKGDSCLHAENYLCAVQNYSENEAKQIDFNSEVQRMDFYLNYSEALYAIGNYTEAHIYYQKLKKIAVQNQDRLYEGKAYSGIAHTLWRMTDNVNSIKQILTSIEIFTEFKDTSNLIIASNILAGIYVSAEKYNDAQIIYKDMLEVAIQSKDSSNIAGNFEYLGVIYFYKGDFQSAIINYKKSLELNEQLSNTFARSINLSNIAEAYLELGEYQEALQILHEAKKLQKKHDFKSVLIFSYFTMGKIYSQLKSYDSAMHYYENSLKLMNETSETRDKHEIYRLIAFNLEKQGNYKKAYEYQQRFSAQKDSLITSQRTRQLEEIKTKYEVGNKIKENEDLMFQNSKKEKELLAQKELIKLQYTIGILIVLFLFISLFLSFNLYRVKRTLINANNSKDKLFGIIAHDLKGPIGNIGAMLKLMEREKNESSKIQYFDYLTQSVQNLSLLTNQLLS